MLNAVAEVDTSISSYESQQDRLGNLTTALTASQRAVSLSRERFDRGLTDSLNVIDAERQEFELEDQYVISQRTAAEQLIALFKALGGRACILIILVEQIGSDRSEVLKKGAQHVKCR